MTFTKNPFRLPDWRDPEQITKGRLRKGLYICKSCGKMVNEVIMVTDTVYCMKCAEKHGAYHTESLNYVCDKCGERVHEVYQLHQGRWCRDCYVKYPCSYGVSWMIYEGRYVEGDYVCCKCSNSFRNDEYEEGMFPRGIECIGDIYCPICAREHYIYIKNSSN